MEELTPTCKKCPKCQEVKLGEHFYAYRRKGREETLSSYCKKCNYTDVKTKRAKLPKKKKASKYTPEERLARDRFHKAQWKKNNPEKAKESARKRMKRKAAADPAFRIKQRVRARIWEMLKQSKSKRTMDYVGCSLTDLKLHLETQFSSGMSWDNYGQWHIDHITPLASFDLTDEAQQNVAFHYTNLQPLWAKDNLQKSAKLNWKKEEVVSA